MSAFYCGTCGSEFQDKEQYNGHDCQTQTCPRCGGEIEWHLNSHDECKTCGYIPGSEVSPGVAEALKEIYGS